MTMRRSAWAPDMPRHDLDEEARLTPTLPAIREGLVRPADRRRVKPKKTVAVDVDDPTQQPPIIYFAHALASG